MRNTAFQEMYQVDIVKFLMIETGTYNDAHLRPFQSVFDGRIQRMFEEATDRGNNLSAAALSGVAGSILQPTTRAGRRADITNGWDTRRFRFIIIAECGIPGNQGAPIMEYISGYTDHADVSLSGEIDPCTQLRFNTSMIARQVDVRDHGVRRMIQQPVNSSHILTSPDAPDNRRGDRTGSRFRMDREDNGVTLLTPMDVLGQMLHADYPDSEVIDPRASLRGNVMRKSRRSNGLATNYLERTLRGVSEAKRQIDGGLDGYTSSSGTSLYAMARSMAGVKEDALSADRFMAYLEEHTHFGEDHFITLGEMFWLFPGLDRVFDARPMTAPMRQTLNVRGTSEYWDTEGPETIVATVLGFSVPGLMMDYLITKYGFHASNDTHTGEFVFRELDGDSVACAGTDITPALDAIQSRILTEIMPDLTHQNNCTLEVTMRVDILGDTSITVCYNGDQPVDYVMPSFADALFAPVIAENNDSLLDLSATLLQLTNPDEENNYRELSPRRRRPTEESRRGNDTNDRI